MPEIKQVVFNTFAGGITDFLRESRLDQYQYADNLLIDRSTMPYSRPGSVLFDAANSRPAGITTRISSCWNFDEDTALLVQNARKVFRYSAGWSELTGPTGNAFFSAGADTARVSGSMWKGHLLLTNDEAANPMKLFRTAVSTFKAVTAGLPKFQSEDAYSAFTQAGANIRDLGNDIRTQFIDHFADATRHPVAADTTSGAGIAAALVATDTLATTIAFVTSLQVAYKLHYTDARKATGSRAYHSNSLGAYPGEPIVPLFYQDAPTSWKQCAQILNDLKRRHNWHMRAIYGHPSVGPDVVTVASLASTEDGPIFGEVSYANIIAFVNKFKRVYNDHRTLGDAHNVSFHTGAMGGAVDTFNAVALADASDYDSAFELTAHVYAAYRGHHADANNKVFFLKATTRTAAGNRKKLDTVTVSGTTPNANYNDLVVGMTVHMLTGGNQFPLGTRLATVGANSVTDTDHDNFAGADETQDFVATRRFYHGGSANESSPSSGVVQEAVTLSDAWAKPSDLYTVLLDAATKYNYHDSKIAWHTVASYHQMVLDELVAFKAFEYAFCYKYEYTTYTGETFIDRSAPYYKTKYANFNVDDRPSQISALPQVANGSTDNYDTSSILIEVYRAANASSNHYLVGEASNGTDTFTDIIADGDLDVGEQLYTDGGILDNDPPPKAKFLHITEDGKALYGYTTVTLDDGTVETIPEQVLLAVQDDPDSVPGGNSVQLSLAVAGVSSIRTLPLVWTAKATYRIEGQFNELGQGSVRAVAISDRIGCVAPGSIVQGDGVVFFAGPDQMYMTDGYRVTPIGKAWSTTYATITSSATRKSNLCGTFDKMSNRIWWGASYGGSENDKCFVLDMNHPVNPDTGGCFTTASNGTSFAPTALCVFSGQLIRGDSRGYVFKHDASYTSDPRVDTSVAGNLWAKKSIIYNYKSGSTNFGADGVRKYATVLEAKFENLGNLSAQFVSDNDLGRVVKSLAAIRARSVTGIIDEKRFFPANGLYFTDKQIQLTNAWVALNNSDTLGLATVSHAGLTVTILAGTWPSDLEDQVISFANDAYVREFTIVSINGAGTILTVSDPGGNLPANGNYKWVLRGYPKDEKMQLESFTIFGIVMGNNQSTVRGESGENA